MGGAVTLQFNTRAQGDIRRITQQLTELQSQMASTVKANDLQGFGSASNHILSARSVKAATDARGALISELQSRFGVQAAALGQVASASSALSLVIREAISANDGRGIATELELSFNSIVAALNEQWNGQPMFAGERQNGKPVKVDTLAELQAATGPQDIYDEANRRQSVEINGASIELAPKASEISAVLFDTIKDLKNLIDAAGGSIGQPITDAQRDSLLNIANRLDGQANAFTNEEGRTGQIQSRFELEQTRLQARSDLLTKEIGDQVDVDVGEVSMQINALLVQYQAAAKTFSDLSQLSLLNFLVQR